MFGTNQRQVGVTIPQGQSVDRSRELEPHSILRIMDDVRFVPAELTDEYGHPFTTMVAITGKNVYIIPRMKEWVASWVPMGEKQSAQLRRYLNEKDGASEVAPSQDTVDIVQPLTAQVPGETTQAPE